MKYMLKVVTSVSYYTISSLVVDILVNLVIILAANMSDETSFCKHCKRFVPTKTFTLHFTHCERFIEICLKCQEPFPKVQLEEHDNEVHKEIDCKDCNQKVEVREQSNHLANHCPKRLISCKYCEVQCIAGNIEDHQVACGSRTELCDICRNHVLIRMLKIHNELHKKSTATNAYQATKNIPNESREKVSNMEEKNVQIPKFRNVVCQNIFQASAALPTSHQQDSENIEKSPSQSARNNEIIPTPQMDDEDSLLPCEFCGASCTFESLEKHQMLCSSNLESCSHCQKCFSFGELSSHICSSSIIERGPLKSSSFEEEYWSRYVEVAPAVKEDIVNEEDSIPCENCGSLFPISCLELHEMACKFSSVSTNTESAMHGNETQPTQLPGFQSTINEEYWSQYATNAANIEKSTAEKEDDIPCENCGSLFPISCLELHEVSCKYSSMSIRKEILPAKTENTVAQENRTYQSGNEVTFLPCSFCNIVISSSILEMHEARCSNFSKQQIIRTQAVKCLPKNTEIRNARSENDSQRTLRVNTLLATENRLPNNPIIQQSQYAVVQLPDGREILKKRNPTVNSNEIGHVLGRSEFIDDGSSIRPKSVNSNLSNNMTGTHFDLGSGMNKEIQKSLFHQNNSAAKNRPHNHYMSGDVQKGNYPEKKQVNTKPLSDHSIEMRLSKKPNTAFTNYAYQPDAGNKLGRGNNSTNGRKQQQSNETTSTSRLQSGNTASANKEQPNPKELNSELQRLDERDRNNGVFLGARPKQPKQ